MSYLFNPDQIVAVLQKGEVLDYFLAGLIDFLESQLVTWQEVDLPSEVKLVN